MLYVNISENCSRKYFWTKEKETRVKFNSGLSANRPSIPTTGPWRRGWRRVVHTENIETSGLSTVPYFFVRSFRYTASYRHGYLDFRMYRGGGSRGFLPNRPRPLSSFDTHARWQPVTQSARPRWSYGKAKDCEQSRQSVLDFLLV